MGKRFIMIYCPALTCRSSEQISFFWLREREKGSADIPFVACAVSSSFTLTDWTVNKRDWCNSQYLYLEVDLLSQFFSLVVLCTGVAVGGQRQEGRAHGAATRLTAEVLGPAGEQVVMLSCHKSTSCSTLQTFRDLHFFKKSLVII